MLLFNIAQQTGLE